MCPTAVETDICPHSCYISFRRTRSCPNLCHSRCAPLLFPYLQCPKRLAMRVSLHRILGFTPLKPEVKRISFPRNAYSVQGYKQVTPVTVGRQFMLARYQTPPMHASINSKNSGLLQEFKKLDSHGIESRGWCSLFLRIRYVLSCSFKPP